jgi:hypothetical protein
LVVFSGRLHTALCYQKIRTLLGGNYEKAARAPLIVAGSSLDRRWLIEAHGDSGERTLTRKEAQKVATEEWERGFLKQ